MFCPHHCCDKGWTHERHPIDHPVRHDMGCVLWTTLIKFNHVIIRPHCANFLLGAVNMIQKCKNAPNKITTFDVVCVLEVLPTQCYFPFCCAMSRLGIVPHVLFTGWAMFSYLLPTHSWWSVTEHCDASPGYMQLVYISISHDTLVLSCIIMYHNH